MSFNFGKEMSVRDGLVFYLDAANPNSYDTVAKTWRNLAGDGEIGYSDVNAPAYNSNYNGRRAIEFDGIDQFISGEIGVNNLIDGTISTDLTVEVCFSIGATQVSKSIFTSGWDGDVFQYSVGISAPVYDDRIYAYCRQGGNTFSVQSGQIYNTNSVPYHIMWVNFGSDKTIYINAQDLGSHGLTISAAPDNLFLIGNSKASYFNGGVNYIKVYNKILTYNERARNYAFAIESRVL